MLFLLALACTSPKDAAPPDEDSTSSTGSTTSFSTTIVVGAIKNGLCVAPLESYCNENSPCPTVEDFHEEYDPYLRFYQEFCGKWKIINTGIDDGGTIYYFDREDILQSIHAINDVPMLCGDDGEVFEVWYGVLPSPGCRD